MKRILSILLVVLMLITSAPLTGLTGLFDVEASAAYSVGDHIQYGNYPQSKVTDSTTLAVLNNASKNWISYNYYTGTGSWNDGKMTASDYMKYADIDIDGDGLRDYRAVTFTQYRPYWTGYSSSTSYTYQDENGYTPNNVYYFKYEPISWRVLDPTTGLIMCESILDSQAYNNYILYSGSYYYGDSSASHYANDYYNSSIRKWLNEDFYNTAFTSSQKSNIRNDVKLNNDCYSSSYPQFNSQASYDKIFLLSYDEVKTSAYGFSSSTSSSTTRQAKGTDYAKSQGLYVYSSSSYYGYSWWWLRSPHSISSGACGVDLGGYSDGDFYYSVSSTDGGVRPACRLSNLKSDIVKSENVETENIEVPLRYDNGTYGTYTYSKSYFNNDANIYNHDLATASLALEVATFNKEYIDETLSDLKVDAKKLYNYSNPTDSFDHIACAVSSKTLDESTSLLIINVRGGNYGVEWGGNFNMGKTGNHEGFNIAADSVISYAEDYVSDHLDILKNNVKVWITGYSRGAATANLVASKLINGVGSSSLSKYSYTNKNVYCYTFETPRNTTNSNRSNSKYSSIFNIVFPIDPVPYLAPEKMSFGRYGVDMYLPCKESVGTKAYNTYKSKVSSEMKNRFGLIYNEDFTFYELGVYVKTNWNWLKTTIEVGYATPNKSLGQYTYMRSLINILSKEVFKDRNYYYSKLQTACEELAATYMGGYSGNQALNNIVSSFKKGFKNGVSNVGDFLNSIDTSGWTVGKVLINAIAGVAVKHPNYIYTTFNNTKSFNSVSDSINQLFYPHTPEVPMSWMFSGNESMFSKSLKTTEYLVNCPVDVYVYNSSNQLVAKIVDDKSVNLDSSISLSYYVDEDGQKRIVLPQDDNYSVEMVASDDGEVNCSVVEYSDDGLELDKVSNYYSMEISKGDTITGKTVSQDGDMETVITSEDNETISADEVLTDNILEYTVNVSTSGAPEDYVYGGGTYTAGSCVKLSANKIDEDSFIGWYVNDELVSTESIYRVIPSKDTTYVAKYDTTLVSNKAEATCTTDGKEAVYKCNKCDTLIGGEVISSTGHMSDEGTVTKAVTCLENGTMTYTCSVCNVEFTEEILASGHKEETVPVVESTCTSTGLTEGKKCSVCGEIFEEQTIVPMISHTDENNDNICDVCGTEIVPECEHASTELIGFKESTCSEEGYTGDTVCKDCGETINTGVKTDKKEHTESAWIIDKDSSCTIGGSKHTECTVCKTVIKTEEIPSGSHNYVDTVVEPTCVADGYTTHTCSICGDTYTDSITNAIGHTEEIIPSVDSTCSTTGLTEGKKCSVCDEILVAPETVAKKAHSYKNVVTKATTSKNGKITPTCTVCGAKKTATTIYYPKTVTIANQAYTGKALKPSVTVKDYKGNIISSKYYTVTCSNNTKMGTATAKVTFKTNYSGTLTKTFKIVPGQVTGLKASPTATTFKLTWNKVVGAKYYKVEYYSTSKKAWYTDSIVTTNSLTTKGYKSGTLVHFRVTALDSTKKYVGTASAVLKTQTLCVAPSIKLTSTKSKTATVSWSKVTGATGYVVWYSKNNKTWTKKATTSTSYTIKSLTGGKRVYVKVQATNSYKLNGALSSTKYVTVKK